MIKQGLHSLISLSHLLPLLLYQGRQGQSRLLQAGQPLLLEPGDQLQLVETLTLFKYFLLSPAHVGRDLLQLCLKHPGLVVHTLLFLQCLVNLLLYLQQCSISTHGLGLQRGCLALQSICGEPLLVNLLLEVANLVVLLSLALLPGAERGLCLLQLPVLLEPLASGLALNLPALRWAEVAIVILKPIVSCLAHRGHAAAAFVDGLETFSDLLPALEWQGGDVAYGIHLLPGLERIVGHRHGHCAPLHKVPPCSCLQRRVGSWSRTIARWCCGEERVPGSQWTGGSGYCHRRPREQQRHQRPAQHP
mmetsp:Transcript_135634/g.377757  ORF Transcript_135634/g.377757 Transcript_135634/m.377757 type:complete len:305 (-) Transcript_135634:157-1071(-)